MKTVLITGANGFIAKKVARTLKGSGLSVIGTSRHPAPVSDYDEVIQGILGEPLKDVFENHAIDAVVHCAFDKDEVDNVKNAQGTRLWAEQAGKHHVELQIFMSSISADEDALAPYGLKKYEVEQWFLENNQIVFRLGLVVGRGGLFGRIISTVKKYPCIPLVDMGRTLFYPSDVDTISAIVRDTVFGKTNIERGKIWYLQQDKAVSFIDILREIRKQYKLFRIFIPVPYFIVSILLVLIENLKFLKFGISTNNLKGLRQVRNKTFRSDLSSLGYPESPIEILIKKTLE